VSFPLNLIPFALAAMSDVEEEIRAAQKQRREAQLAKGSELAERPSDEVAPAKARKYEAYDTSIAVGGNGDVDMEDTEVRQLDSCEYSEISQNAMGLLTR
jgi:hypothetical protein